MKQAEVLPSAAPREKFSDSRNGFSCPSQGPYSQMFLHKCMCLSLGRLTGNRCFSINRQVVSNELRRYRECESQVAHS